MTILTPSSGALYINDSAFLAKVPEPEIRIGSMREWPTSWSKSLGFPRIQKLCRSLCSCEANGRVGQLETMAKPS